MRWLDIFQNRNKQSRWDWHLFLYFLNVFLIVYGYGLRDQIFLAVKMLRMGIVSASLIGLLFALPQGIFRFDKRKNWVVYGFLLLNIVVLPFSVDFVRSIERIAAWIPFLIYTNYFVVYLFTRYTKDEAKIKLLQVYSLAYFYPVALMFAYGIMFQTENIYGQTIGSYRTNVLGWACAFFILTSFDLYANYPIPKWMRILFFIAVLLSLWGIVLTGSRSSYASLALGTMVLVLRSNQVSRGLKVAASIFILGFAYYIINSADSVVNLRASYADIRHQRGEIRFKLAETATNTFLDNPLLLITGFGFDGFQKGLKYYAGVKTDLAPHNSYLEIFFSSGILAFLFFMVFFAGNAVWKYLRFDSQHFVFFPMLLIVPYFESNLNAGQFLFFPWMTILFYYIHVSSLQFRIANIE